MEIIPVLTLDGPSGVGKGSVARIVAGKMDWNLLDSGAIYRGFALASKSRNIAFDDEQGLVELAKKLDLKFESVEGQELLNVYLDGVEVSKELRTEQTAELASQLAVIASLRVALLKKQQQFEQAPGLVADGRDMGTVVFPNAPYKVYLTASAQERAQRRLKTSWFRLAGKARNAGKPTGQRSNTPTQTLPVGSGSSPRTRPGFVRRATASGSALRASYTCACSTQPILISGRCCNQTAQMSCARGSVS